MNSPILEYEAQQEHHNSKSIEGNGRRHLAIAQSFPKPFQDRQRNSVDQPERENTSNGLGRCELPCLVRRPTIYGTWSDVRILKSLA
jgi:hypothetical protein